MTSRFRLFAAKLSGMFGRRKADHEFDDEMRLHLQLLTERYIRQGMRPEEAASAARRQFGNTTLLQQGQREMRSIMSLSNLGRDLRFSVRQLRRNPTLALVAITSLALGIGANTAIFAVAKKVLLDTLPVKDPKQLRMLTWVAGHDQKVPLVWGDASSNASGDHISSSFSYPVFEELRKQRDAFQYLFAFKDVQMTATVDGQPDLVSTELVSGDTFNALGVQPILDRPLTAADDTDSSAGPVAVISEAYWAAHFARSSSALGKTISLNGIPTTIVGIAPGSFTGLQMDTVTQVFVPLVMQPLLLPRPQNSSTSLLNNPQSWWLLVMARLRPDVPEIRAQARLDAILRQAAAAGMPDGKAPAQFHLQFQPGDRGLDYLKDAFAKPSYMLLSLSGLVLLLACVNLANLLLARVAAREREVSTRLALGAGRAHIVRQMLTESLLLSSLGGAAGLLVGYLGRNLIPHLLAKSWSPERIQLDFDGRVIAFTVGVSLATGILFGLAPAWQATRTNVNSGLKDTTHATYSRQKMGLGKGLVIFQIALSAILLIGAGLFVRTLVNLNHTPLGFRPDNILLFRLAPPKTRYTGPQSTALYSQLEKKLAVIPGVRSVSLSTIAIVGDGYSGSTFHVSGRPIIEGARRVQMNIVGTDFLSTLGISIMRGRSFNTHDTYTSPKVAVVNQTLAQKYFPNQDPLGQTFENEDADGPIQIVGIAADTRYANLRSPTPPLFYLPYLQHPDNVGRMVVELRTFAEPSGIVNQVRAAVASLDPNLPLIEVRTMTQQIDSSLSNERIFARLTAGFGLLALLLACIGIYGIMTYTVARRTSEIGIRMALGARADQVLSMVLREVSWMALAGVAIGIGGALWLGRFLSAMLYGLKPSDPLTLITAAALLAIIALLAALGPARRASRIDPIRALRHE
ncbi:MAG: ABC transporter permease [Acidobacteria bacterium]|nr:ABC transporter permease [Acidobacteriota bacterium]